MGMLVMMMSVMISVMVSVILMMMIMMTTITMTMTVTTTIIMIIRPIVNNFIDNSQQYAQHNNIHQCAIPINTIHILMEMCWRLYSSHVYQKVYGKFLLEYPIVGTHC